ncbi:hypothetical protein DFQ29_007248 [Apophysomyces sp. BC1021]|nr:hypothetical protein DFQ29_007248 [Apophysomyces sp. BC1021]
MHEEEGSSSKNEITKARRQSKQQQKSREQEPKKRTGPLSTDISPSKDAKQQKEQHRKTVATAVSTMAQTTGRNRPTTPRSHIRRKYNIINRNGGQEIDVPQSLTHEQRLYQFPPRSRLLKELVKSDAEKRRQSTLPESHPLLMSPPASPVLTRVHDENALQEYFSSTDRRTRDIDAWITETQRSTQLQPRQNRRISTSRTSSRLWNQVQPLSSPSLLSLQESTNIQFQSEAGKRWIMASGHARSSSCFIDPPAEHTNHVHCVPRRLLRKNGPSRQQNQHPTSVAETETQAIWRGGDMPVTAMAQLFQQLNESFQLQQQKDQERMRRIEAVLEDERRRREVAEEGQRASAAQLELLRQKLETTDNNSSPDDDPNGTYHQLLARLSNLQRLVVQEQKARKDLQNVVTSTAQKVDTLQAALDKETQQNQKERRDMQKQLDRAVAELQSLKQSSRGKPKLSTKPSIAASAGRRSIHASSAAVAPAKTAKTAKTANTTNNPRSRPL